MKRYDLPQRKTPFAAIAWIAGGVLALALLISAIILFPRIFQWRSEALFAQATQLAEAGNPEAAARKAEAAYRLFPQNLPALRLAALSLTESDPATARRLTFELAASPFASPEDFRLVLPTLEKQPIAELDAFFNRLPASIQNDPALLDHLSERWFAEADLKKAADYASRSLKVTPNPLIALRLGLILADDPATESESAPWLVQAIETGTSAEAFPALEALTKLPPAKLAAVKIPDSDLLIQKFPNATPDQIFTLFRIEWQLRPNRHAEMLDQLAVWQKSLPRPELGNWLADLGESARLIEWITPREAMPDPVLFDRYARALVQVNRADELLALLPNFGAISPEITNPLLVHFRQRGQTAQLLQLADLLAAQSPESDDYLNLSAYLNFLSGKVDDAMLGRLSTEILADPTNHTTRTALALGYAKKGDNRRAFELLSAEPNPQIKLTDSDKIVLARVWSKAGKMPEARAFLSGVRAETLLPEEKNLLTQP